MVEGATFETFSGRVGEEFSVDLPGGRVRAELASVEGGGGAPGRGGRPFSLVFRAGEDRPFGQGTYTLGHPELGEGPVFLVPVGRDRGGLLYEAVFN